MNVISWPDSAGLWWSKYQCVGSEIVRAVSAADGEIVVFRIGGPELLSRPLADERWGVGQLEFCKLQESNPFQ